jgi:hypothetical protein
MAPAEAASPTIGRLGVGGTGCPAGSVSAALGSNTLSLKFRSFKASAGGARSFDRKACGVAIPMQVPAGLSVAIVGVTYRGLANLPSGASARLEAEIFFAGGQGPKTSKTVNGPTKGSFSFSTAATATVWSPCGAALNLRVNTSLLVKTAGGASASTSVTSQDVGAGLVYQLKYRSC